MSHVPRPTSTPSLPSPPASLHWINGAGQKARQTNFLLSLHCSPPVMFSLVFHKDPLKPPQPHAQTPRRLLSLTPQAKVEDTVWTPQRLSAYTAPTQICFGARETELWTRDGCKPSHKPVCLKRERQGGRILEARLMSVEPDLRGVSGSKISHHCLSECPKNSHTWSVGSCRERLTVKWLEPSEIALGLRVFQGSLIFWFLFFWNWILFYFIW